MQMVEKVKQRTSLTTGRTVKLIILAAFVALASGTQLWAGPDDGVPYPKGYRNWTHVKTSIIGPKHPGYEKFGGIQHIYANEKALEGYQTGRFPEGSVLVYDFLFLQDTSPSTTDSTPWKGSSDQVSSLKEGPRRFTSVMVKDSKRYAETGGWGYEEWRGDSQTDRMIANEAATKCYACHTSQKDRDFVFSRYRP